jgi:hypothetical protein
MYFTYTSGQNYLRTITQGVSLTDSRNLSADYKRSLTQIAKVESEIRPFRILLARIADTVHAAGNVFRGLLLQVRIVTGVFVRDYLLGRFLKAREELILKSAISREIELESKIQ